MPFHGFFTTKKFVKFENIGVISMKKIHASFTHFLMILDIKEFPARDQS